MSTPCVRVMIWLLAEDTAAITGSDTGPNALTAALLEQENPACQTARKAPGRITTGNAQSRRRGGQGCRAGCKASQKRRRRSSDPSQYVQGSFLRRESPPILAGTCWHLAPHRYRSLLLLLLLLQCACWLTRCLFHRHLLFSLHGTSQ